MKGMTAMNFLNQVVLADAASGNAFGTYGMILQGYYREGSADDVKDWDGNSLFAYDLYKDGKENHYATYFANTTTAPMSCCN